MMRRWMIGCALIALATTLLPVTATAQTRVRMGTLAPRGSSFHKILQEMSEEWKSAPGGGVTLTLFTDGTMGSEADMVRRMRAGQLQGAMLSAGGLGEIDRSVNALLAMPMMFRSLDEVDYVLQQLRPALEAKLAEKGFVIMFWGDAGWVRIFSRAPVTRPVNLRNQKIFVSAGSHEQIAMMKALGYQPVPLEITDALTGLQTGLVDIMPSPPFYALAGQFYRPAPHMLELNFVPLVGGTVILKSVWDKLSPDARAAMLKAAEAAGAKVRERNRIEAEESVAVMQKNGLKITPLTPELEQEWRAFAEETYPRIRGRIVPDDMFDEVRRLLTQYRQRNGN